MGYKKEESVWVFDGQCRFCLFSIFWLKKTKIASDTNTCSIQNLEDTLLALIDLERFITEIAIIDLKTREVHYGAQAILSEAAAAYPAFSLITRYSAFRYLADIIYKTVSYNRTIILPSSENNKGIRCPCEPPFHCTYRIVYLIAIGIFTGILALPLSSLWNLLTHQSFSLRSYIEVLIILFLPVLFFLLAIRIKSDRKWDHAGHFMSHWIVLCLIWLPVAISYIWVKSEIWMSQIIILWALLSFILGNYLYFRRISLLKLNRWWMLTYLLLYWGTSVALLQLIGLLEALRHFT